MRSTRRPSSSASAMQDRHESGHNTSCCGARMTQQGPQMVCPCPSAGAKSAQGRRVVIAPAGVGLHVDAPMLRVQAVCRQGAVLAQVLHAVDDLVTAVVPGQQRDVCSTKNGRQARGHHTEQQKAYNIEDCTSDDAAALHMQILKAARHVKIDERHASAVSAHLAPGWPSLYLLVRHEPSASITGAEVKFSLAISSMPFLQRQHKHALVCIAGRRSVVHRSVCGQ